MLKEHPSLVSYINQAFDFLLTTCSFFLAFEITKYLGEYFVSFKGLRSLGSHLWMLLVIIPAWKFSLTIFGVYDPQRVKSVYRYVLQITQAIMLGGLICSSSVYIFQYPFSRSFLFVFLVVNYILLVAWKLTVHRILHSIRQRGYNFRMGPAVSGQRFSHLQSRPHHRPGMPARLD